MDKTQVVKVYTDGSCTPNPGKGSWGFVVKFHDDTIVKDAKPSVEDVTTNNRMEATPVLAVLQQLLKRGFLNIKLITDSQYVIRGITSLDAWLDKPDLKNRDIWVAIGALIKQYSPKIETEWVKGHNGHEFNEMCDKMASVGHI